MSIDPTGRREVREGAPYVVYTRTFRAPIEDVWAAVTEPERLERWIGTWTGDPATGQVAFTMTAEGDDVETEVYRIVVCEPPRRLVTRSSMVEGADGQSWLLELDLAERDG
ncbi:MAG: SRPBCC domain-containing protein, partial [Nocardioides sp.]|nr:SRPBCC domain-containing protein [Nocardioides sp.]